MKKHQSLCLLWLLAPLYGQNLVNLQTQTKNVDFSSAVSTKPAKSGTALPATCSTGEMYFKTNNPSGQNLYGCSSVNTWSLQSVGATGTVAIGTAGQFGYYTTNGTAIVGRTLLPADIPALSYQLPLTFTGNGAKTASSTGSTTTNNCAKWDANGNIVDAGAACGSGGGGGGGGLPAQTGTPAFLTTNGTTSSWGNIPTGESGALDCATAPGICDIVTAVVPLKATANAWTGANDFSGASFLRLTNGVGAPSTGCTAPTNVGSVYVRSDAKAANSSFYVCAQTAATVFGWELVQGASSGSGSGTVLAAGYSNGIFGTSGYQATGSVVSVNGPKTVLSFAFVLPTAAVINAFDFAVGTAATSNCGSGTGACGYAMQITDPTGAISLCISSVAIGGTGSASDINSVGPKTAAAVAGSDYAAGYCTLPAGSYLFQEASDSTTLAVLTTNLSGSEAMMSVNHPNRGGFSAASIATGSGATLAIGNASTAAFTPFSNALGAGHLPLIVLENN